MKRLVALALTPGGEVREDVAARLLETLSRSQLKDFLAALRRELKRRRVHVTVAGTRRRHGRCPVASVIPAARSTWPG